MLRSRDLRRHIGHRLLDGRQTAVIRGDLTCQLILIRVHDRVSSSSLGNCHDLPTLHCLDTDA